MCGEYSTPLETFFGPAVASAAVESLVESLLEPDPIGDAVRLAEDELRLSVEREGNVIRLNNAIRGDPRRTLMSVISLCEQVPLVVIAEGGGGSAAIAIWHKPELLLATSYSAGTRGARYELRGFGPGTFKDDIEGLPKPKERWVEGDVVPQRSRTLIEAAGVWDGVSLRVD